MFRPGPGGMRGRFVSRGNLSELFWRRSVQYLAPAATAPDFDDKCDKKVKV